LLAPTDGATVSGTVEIQAPLLENPCFIAAAVYFTVIDGEDRVVFAKSDNGLPAIVHWDTCQVPNGTYAIRSQRACNWAPACSELGGPVHVQVLNQ
jgi:hypothetical protein